MTTLKKAAEQSAFAKFWIVSGGSIDRAWDHRKWTELRNLAVTLPKLAWSAGAAFERARILELLKGSEGMNYAFSRYEDTKCSKNDAHIVRSEWARWLESKLKETD